jgi:hypothetical protein
VYARERSLSVTPGEETPRGDDPRVCHPPSAVDVGFSSASSRQRTSCLSELTERHHRAWSSRLSFCSPGTKYLCSLLVPSVRNPFLRKMYRPLSWLSGELSPQRFSGPLAPVERTREKPWSLSSETCDTIPLRKRTSSSSYYVIKFPIPKDS